MTKVTSYWKLLLTMGLVSYFLACSNHKFTRVDDTAAAYGGLCNETSPGVMTCSDSKTVGDGIVDILFINDNSGSMSFEQNQMASKFPTFIQNLGNISWRIGMITTDVTGSKGGRLLPFGSKSILQKGDSNAATLFSNTIRRQETIDCENSGYNSTSCPSSDERGLYAANLFLLNYSAPLLRASAPLAVIVLADEDVRSGLYGTNAYSSYTGSRNTADKPLGYDLTQFDTPQSVVSTLSSKYPNKPMSIHSFVIKNGDSGCLSAQNSQGQNVIGSYGKKYEEASQLTNGIVGSICSSNYETQLGQIAYDIQNQVTSMKMVCRPINDEFDWTATPQPAQTVTATADFNTLVVSFDKPFPPGTKITISYSCEKDTSI